MGISGQAGGSGDEAAHVSLASEDSLGSGQSSRQGIKTRTGRAKSISIGGIGELHLPTLVLKNQMRDRRMSGRNN